MPLIIFLITLLFSPFILPEPLQAEVFHPSVALRDFMPKDKAFHSVRRAYKNLKYNKAIRLTKKLRRNKTNEAVAQTAAFLLGDLYYDLAENGEPTYFKKAIISYENARRKYRDSEEAIVALWKIGTIYMKQQLYYEAVASFQRIANQYPTSPHVKSAHFAKAQTYLQWEKQEKAIKALDEINPPSLTHNERMVLLLGYGDTYSQLRYFNTAFEYYKLVPINEGILQLLPKTLYRYGIAALRSKEYRLSRDIMAILDQNYPGGPDTLLAITRIGDAWRLQGMSHRSKQFYKAVSDAQKLDTNGQKAKLMAAVGSFHLAGCYPKPVLLRKSECQQMKALKSKPGLQALKKIEESSDFLIKQLDDSHHIEQILFETIIALERHKAYTTSLSIREASLEMKISIDYREKLKEKHRNTVVKAVDQLLNQQENLEIFQIYFRYLPVFTEGKTQVPLNIRIGTSLTDAGFHQEAVDLLSPITSGKTQKHAIEALFQMVRAKFEQGEYNSADRFLKQFLARYPKSSKISLLQAISAQMADRQGHTNLAIKKYRVWLKRYPKHPMKIKILTLLATAHEKQGNLNQTITSYLKIKKENRKADPDLDLKIGDLYYRLKKYKKAVGYYGKTLELVKEGREKEWVSFQLANSYKALGLIKKGTPLFTRLADGASDDLIKGMSEQKLTRLKNQ